MENETKKKHFKLDKQVNTMGSM